MKLDSSCSVIEKVVVDVPDQSLLSRVLRDNGYSGTVGIEILHKYYGSVVSIEASTLFAFFGLHYGRRNCLLSKFWLKYYHFLLRRPMNAGFFGCQTESDYPGLQILWQKLGSQIEIDIVGCMSIIPNHGTLSEAARSPNEILWIGVCQKGWLGIDPYFYLLNVYQSLSDLLQEKSGVEIVSVDD